MTPSNGSIFPVTGPAGNSLATGEFPAQRPVTQSLDVFFDLRLNKRLSKQSWGWWLETPSHSLRRHCNKNAENVILYIIILGYPSTLEFKSLTNYCRCRYKVLTPAVCYQLAVSQMLWRLKDWLATQSVFLLKAVQLISADRMLPR